MRTSTSYVLLLSPKQSVYAILEGNNEKGSKGYIGNSLMRKC